MQLFNLFCFQLGVNLRMTDKFDAFPKHFLVFFRGRHENKKYEKINDKKIMSHNK